MTYDSQKHHRRSVRLKDCDYSRPGWYFVTICVQDHICILGEIADSIMHRNVFGDMVQACWNNLPIHYPQVVPDAFVVMPNHVHGIIGLVDSGEVGAGITMPLNRRGLIN